MGTKLLDRWLTNAREAGVEAVHLGANANNHGALRFWGSRGFSRSGRHWSILPTRPPGSGRDCKILSQKSSPYGDIVVIVPSLADCPQSFEDVSVAGSQQRCYSPQSDNRTESLMLNDPMVLTPVADAMRVEPEKRIRDRGATEKAILKAAKSLLAEEGSRISGSTQLPAAQDATSS